MGETVRRQAKHEVALLGEVNRGLCNGPKCTNVKGIKLLHCCRSVSGGVQAIQKRTTDAGAVQPDPFMNSKNLIMQDFEKAVFVCKRCRSVCISNP